MKIGIILLAIISVLLIGCGGGENSCDTVSDCSQKRCNQVSCVDKQCVYEPIDNCCGNGIEEDTENGKPGNECTCPQDYGKCDGAAKIPEGRREVDSEYVKRYCNEEDRCVMGVEESLLKPVTLVVDQSLPDFDLELTSTFNQPFRVPTDSFDFTFRLKDADEGVVYPIRITHISLKSGEKLIGQISPSVSLTSVGQTQDIAVPADFSLDAPEQEMRISYEVEYEYVVNKERFGIGGTTTEQETVRNSFENRFSSRILFAQDE